MGYDDAITEKIVPSLSEHWISARRCAQGSLCFNLAAVSSHHIAEIEGRRPHRWGRISSEPGRGARLQQCFRSPLPIAPDQIGRRILSLCLNGTAGASE